jgi:hypothetical protein
VVRAFEDGRRAIADPSRRFVDVVEDVMPGSGTMPKCQEVIDAALETVERLVQALYDIVRRAGQNEAADAENGQGAGAESLTGAGEPWRVAAAFRLAA